MFGNLSIRPKTVALLAVPVAGTLLLGGVGVGAGWGDRARATGDRRLAAAAGLAVVRAEVDRRLVTLERTMADLDRTVADLLEVTRQLTDRLDAPAATRAARLLLAVAAAKEATGRERSLLAATRAGAEPATARPAATGRARAAGNARAQAPPAGDAPDQAPPARTGPDRFLVARLTAAAAVARHELIGVRAVAGERLDEVDRALAVPGARRARGLELALLQPAEGAPALADPGAWRAGLAGRAAGPQAVAAATVPGLARRGQALAERQLQLLEELVRDEPDPGAAAACSGSTTSAPGCAAPPRPCSP